MIQRNPSHCAQAFVIGHVLALALALGADDVELMDVNDAERVTVEKDVAVVVGADESESVDAETGRHW